ncbi:hypothetical protein [Herbaspirillum sp. alder98]|nr:hypothetical protein [Herbaspirillum sp. alder98]MCA1323560.1 hypothetical protein [Herbaspirillum sp. alder98]
MTLIGANSDAAVRLPICSLIRRGTLAGYSACHIFSEIFFVLAVTEAAS